jgi:carboxyl-terminal processing protease
MRGFCRTIQGDASRCHVIIGEPAWGSTGQPLVTDFRNGMSLSVSTKRESFPDGSQFEGIGIIPDTEVHPTADDLRTGTDPVLYKPITLARKSEVGRN